MESIAKNDTQNNKYELEKLANEHSTFEANSYNTLHRMMIDIAIR